MKILTPKFFKFPLNSIKESEKIHEALSVNFFIASSRTDKTDKKRIKLSGFAFLEYLFDHRYFVYNNYVPSWQRSSFFPASVFLESFDTEFSSEAVSSFRRPLKSNKIWPVLKSQIYGQNKLTRANNSVNEHLSIDQYNALFSQNLLLWFHSYRLFNKNVDTELLPFFVYDNEKMRSYFYNNKNMETKENYLPYFTTSDTLLKTLTWRFLKKIKQTRLSKIWPWLIERSVDSCLAPLRFHQNTYLSTSLIDKRSAYCAELARLRTRRIKNTDASHFLKNKNEQGPTRADALKINPLPSLSDSYSETGTGLFKNEIDNSFLIGNTIQSNQVPKDKIYNTNNGKISMIQNKVSNTWVTTPVISNGVPKMKWKTHKNMYKNFLSVINKGIANQRKHYLGSGDNLWVLRQNKQDSVYTKLNKESHACLYPRYKEAWRNEFTNNPCVKIPFETSISNRMPERHSVSLIRSEKTVSSNRLLASLVSILNTTNFRDILFERFMNAKFYDIGLMGRKRLNKKLRLNIPLQCTTLTPLDFLAIFYKLFSLYNNFSLIQNFFPTQNGTLLKTPFLGDSFALSPKVNPWSNSKSKMYGSSGSVAFRQLASTNIGGATLSLAVPGVGNVFKPRNNLLDSAFKQSGSLDHLNQRHIRTSGEFLFLQFWRAILRFYQVLSQLSSRSNFIKSSYTAAGKTERNFFSLSSISLFPSIGFHPIASPHFILFGTNKTPEKRQAEPGSSVTDQTEYILPISNNQTHVLKAYGYFSPINSNNDSFTFNSYQYQCFQNTMSGEFVVNSNNTSHFPNKTTGSSSNNLRRETLNRVINRNDLNSILPYTPYFQTSVLPVGNFYNNKDSRPIKQTQPYLNRLNTAAQKIVSTCAQFKNYALKQNKQDSIYAQYHKILFNKIDNPYHYNKKPMMDDFILMSPKYLMERCKNKMWWSVSSKTNSYFSNRVFLNKFPFQAGFLESFNMRFYRANLMVFKTFFNKNHMEPSKLWTNKIKKPTVGKGPDFSEGIMTLKWSQKPKAIMKLNSNKSEFLTSPVLREGPKKRVSNLRSSTRAYKATFNSKIEMIIKKLLYETKELRVFDAKERMRNLETKLFNGVFKEFFNLDPLSQDLDETNGLSEIIHKRRISALGKGGVTSKNAPLSIRSIHPSFYGRLCPIDSPEGDRVGLINSLTNYARINETGYIATPFYRTRHHDSLQPTQRRDQKHQKFSPHPMASPVVSLHAKQWGRTQQLNPSLLTKKSTLQMRICPPIAFFGKIYNSYDISPSLRLSSQDMIYNSSKTRETTKWNNYKTSHSKQIVFHIGSINIERTYKYFLKSSYLRPDQINSFSPKIIGTKPVIGNLHIYRSNQNHFKSTGISDFRRTLEPMPSFGLSKTQQRGFAYSDLLALPVNLKENVQNDFSYTNSNRVINQDNHKISRKLELFLFYDTHYMTPPITHRETIINNAKDKNMGHVYTPFLTCYFDFVSFQGYAPITAFQFFSPGVGLIPFLEHDDGTRALMGANMQRQAVPLISASRPIVGTGLEKNVAASFIISSSNSGYLYYISGKQSKQIFSGFRPAFDQFSKTRDFKSFGLGNLARTNINKQIIEETQFLRGVARAEKSSMKYFVSKTAIVSPDKTVWRPSTFYSRAIIQPKHTTPSSFLGAYKAILPFYPSKSSMALYEPINNKFKKKPLIFRLSKTDQNLNRLFSVMPLKTRVLKTLYHNMMLESKNYLLDLFQCASAGTERKYRKILSARAEPRKKITSHKQDHHFILNTHWLPYRKSYKATIINKKPAISENSWLQKGDLLVDGTSSINGELALGRNLFSIYMPWEGYNFEDAILISDKAAQGYTTIHVEEFSVKTSKNEFVSSIVQPFTWINLGDILVSKKRRLENEFIMNRLLFGMSSKPKMKSLDNDFLYDTVSDYNFYGDKQLLKNSQNKNAQKHELKYDTLSYKDKVLLFAENASLYGNIERAFHALPNQKIFGYYLVSPWQNKLSNNHSRYTQNFTKALTIINQPNKEDSNRDQKFKLPFSTRRETLNTLKVPRPVEHVLKNKDSYFPHSISFFARLRTRQYKPFSVGHDNKKGNITGEILNNCSQLGSPFYKITISGETSFLTEQGSKTDHPINLDTPIVLDDKQSSLLGINEKDLKIFNPQSSFGLKKNDNFEIDTSYRTGESICGWVISVKSQSQHLPATEMMLQESENKDRVLRRLDTKTRMLEQNQFKDENDTPSVQKSSERSVETSNENFNTINSPSKIEPLSKPVIGIYTGSIQKFLSLLSIFHKNIELKNNIFHDIKKSWTKPFNHQKTTSKIYQPAFRFSTKINPLGYLLLKNTFKTRYFTWFQKPNNIILKWSQNEFKTESLKKLSLSSPAPTNHDNPSLFLYRNPDTVPRIKTESAPFKTTNNSRQRSGGDTIYIYIAVAKPLQVGDKMSGRHGNKGIISKILPFYDMPYLIDGTPIDIVLNPLGVPSRMNVGQIYESLLGLTGFYKHEYYRIPPFDENYSSQFSRNFVYWKLNELKDLHFFKRSQAAPQISTNITTDMSPSLTQLSPFLNSSITALFKTWPLTRINFTFRTRKKQIFSAFSPNHKWSKKNAFLLKPFFNRDVSVSKLLNPFKITKYFGVKPLYFKNFKYESFFGLMRMNLNERVPNRAKKLKKNSLNIKHAPTINWNTSLLWCSQLKIEGSSNNFSKPKFSRTIYNNNVSTCFRLAFKKNWFFSFPSVQSESWLSSKQVMTNLPFYTQKHRLDTSFINKKRPKIEKFGLNPYFPGKMRLLNGLTGETFYRPIIVGKSYMLKLIHLVHHKIHARATGPYALITQQPLKGKRNQGGQRMGEMEIWALYGFGSASILYEMLTIKSDDPVGRERILREIAGLKENNSLNSNWKNNENSNVLSLRDSTQFWKNAESGVGSKVNDSLEKGISESFRVLVMNLRALCLDMQVFKDLAN